MSPLYQTPCSDRLNGAMIGRCALYENRLTFRFFFSDFSSFHLPLLPLVLLALSSLFVSCSVSHSAQRQRGSVSLSVCLPQQGAPLCSVSLSVSPSRPSSFLCSPKKSPSASERSASSFQLLASHVLSVQPCKPCHISQRKLYIGPSQNVCALYVTLQKV